MNNEQLRALLVVQLLPYEGLKQLHDEQPPYNLKVKRAFTAEILSAIEEANNIIAMCKDPQKYGKSLELDFSLASSLPAEVVEAEQLMSNYFKRMNVKYWELGNSKSR